MNGWRESVLVVRPFAPEGASASLHWRSRSDATVGTAQRVACCTAMLILCLLAACDWRSGTNTKATSTSPAIADALAAKAQAGDTGAMFDLARAHERGTDGLAKDEFLAFKWYLRAADAGLPKAMGEVAKRYWDGRGVREDLDASRRWTAKYAATGVADAGFLFDFVDPDDWPLLLASQQVVITHAEEAKYLREQSAELSRWNRAAQAGNLNAKLHLANVLRSGVSYYRKPKSVARSADKFLDGPTTYAIQPDPKRALSLLSEAADAGSAMALLELARWYQSGGNGLTADSELASKYWDRVEAISEPDGQFAIGQSLQSPQERKWYGSTQWRNESLSYESAGSKSVEWLGKAADQGHARAALKIAKSAEKAGAFKYLLQAAEAGLIDGQYLLARAYFEGTGVAKDHARAYAWAHRAATHPTATATAMAESQSFLAYLLGDGKGAEKDVVLAYAWANVSAATGNEWGKKLVTYFDSTLDPSQIREAQAISTSWKLGEDMKRIGNASAGGGGGAGSASAASGAGADAKLTGSGTGFFVSTSGVLITNYHVAGKCTEVKLPALKKTATIVATDVANDLAVLRVLGAPEVSARLSDPSKLRQGQEIAAFGFPLDGYLPSAGNITTGLVSALSGPANNSSLIQISAPVQQGNSGGPVLNTNGEVVGVVVGKADAIRIAKATGDILQNVNFAISPGTLKGFLDANQVEYRRSSFFSFAKKPDTLADEARQFTVKIECWR